MSVCRVPGPVDPGSPGVPGIVPGITRAGYPGRFFSNLGNPGFRRFGSTSFAGFPNPDINADSAFISALAALFRYPQFEVGTGTRVPRG